MKKHIKLINLLFCCCPLMSFAMAAQAQQWAGPNSTSGTICRSAGIKVGYGPLYLDWTYQNNWNGNANNWAGYIGFNAIRNNNDPKDNYYGENPYTSKAVFEGSNYGFRWLYRVTGFSEAAGQHQLSELMRIGPLAT